MKHRTITLWTCSQCPIDAFESHFALSRHWFTHHLKGVFVCVDCNFTGHYRIEVMEHHDLVHQQRGQKRKEVEPAQRSGGLIPIDYGPMPPLPQGQLYRAPSPGVSDPYYPGPSYDQQSQNCEPYVEPYVPEPLPPSKRQKKRNFSRQQHSSQNFVPDMSSQYYNHHQSQQELFQRDCDYRAMSNGATPGQIASSGSYYSLPQSEHQQQGTNCNEYDGPVWQNQGYNTFSSTADYSCGQFIERPPSCTLNSQFDFGFMPPPPPPPLVRSPLLPSPHLPPPQAHQASPFGNYQPLDQHYHQQTATGPFFESSRTAFNYNSSSFHPYF